MSQDVPWYKDIASQLPFHITKKISSNSPDAQTFRSLAFFPWTYDSLQTLWNGHVNIKQDEWDIMINTFSDSVAVGSTSNMYIFFIKKSQNPLCYKVPSSEENQKSLPIDCIHVAWALNLHEPLEPLVLFSHLSLLYIYNVKRKALSGFLRGHGGTITSIAVHPVNTHLFCTTSRDYTTRIYDLTLSPQDVPNNPCWPPGKSKSHAGAAHGLHMTEDEGKGIGRCIIVLMGGRSGGHQAAVLAAAFHPHFRIIATCGLDRHIKIWHIPGAKLTDSLLAREDKPLFSTSRLHKARVTSIAWLQPDLLITSSAPAIMKDRSGDNSEVVTTYLEPGKIIVWRWLSLDRFFPPGQDDIQQDVLRGCASDYQESNSFKIISMITFPKSETQFEVPILHVYQSDTHDPIVLYTCPQTGVINMFNIIHLQPRKPPPFPHGEQGHAENADNIPLWKIVPYHSGAESGELISCAMGMNGTTIVGVGTKGTIWIWTKLST